MLTAPAPGQTRVYGAVVAAATASVLPVFLFGGMAVQIRADLRFSEAAQGWVAFGYFALSSLVSAPFGRIVERLGATRSVRLGVLGSGLALLLASLSRSLGFLLGALALGGAVNALIQPGTNLLIVSGVRAGRNGLAFATKQSAIPAATLLAGLAVPALALTVGWRWAFALAALLALATIPLVPSVPPRSLAVGGRTGRIDVPMVALALVGVGAGLGAGTANALGAFLTSSAVHAGFSDAAAGALLAFGSVIGLGSRLYQGWRADRRGGGHFRAVVLMLAGGACGVALLASLAPPLMVLGTVAAFGLGWAWPGVFHLAVALANPSAPAAATGVAQTGNYAGSALGPLAFGYLAESQGYRVAWLVFAAVALLAAVLVNTVRSAFEPR